MSGRVFANVDSSSLAHAVVGAPNVFTVDLLDEEGMSLGEHGAEDWFTLPTYVHLPRTE